ncbi:MAG: 4Fe-4S binding protein [Planctomycetota bacterium]|jgi:dissimilatory sulfite reductase (desulfoviridin) alpha/beta subunit
MSEEAAYDLKALKAGGFMKQKEPDLFSVRLRVVGGFVNAEQLEKLAEVARKYGHGHVHLTTRQGVEVPYVAFRDMEGIRSDLKQTGLEFGACGPRVRTITACQGGSCSHGLIDSQALAARIDERVFGRSGLPHKFKIGITGCPNACIKPQENDLGIMGIVLKTFHEDLCDRCGLCVHACPIPGALEVKDDRLVYREDICVRCGNCVAACPTDAWEKTWAGYALFVGGKMGKRPRFGDRLPIEVRSEDDILAIVDRTIDWYAVNGTKGERFGDTLDRIGVEALASQLH